MPRGPHARAYFSPFPEAAPFLRFGPASPEAPFVPIGRQAPLRGRVAGDWLPWLPFSPIEADRSAFNRLPPGAERLLIGSSAIRQREACLLSILRVVIRPLSTRQLNQSFPYLPP